MPILHIYSKKSYPILEKMDTCENDPNKSSITKINKHTPLGYSIFTHCSFDESKNKLNFYRGDDCMKKFCKDLREHSTTIINYEKKKMISLTTEEKIHYNKQKVCYICKKEFDHKMREHSTTIIDYEKKKMISLTTEEKIHYNKQKVCYICKKEFDHNKKQQKVRDHCHYTGKYRGAAHNICNLRYKIPKEINTCSVS